MSNNDDLKTREYVRRLFRDDGEREPDTPAPADPTLGNRVPDEGTNERPPDPEGDLRAFTKALFESDY